MGFLNLNLPGRKDLKEVLEKDWEKIEGAFSSFVKRKGEKYFFSGKVIATDITKRDARFRSSGQFAKFYSINVVYDRDSLLSMCTCPSDPPCKHIYASLLILKRKGGPEVREILMRLNREELMEILLDHLSDEAKRSLIEGPWNTLREAQRHGDFQPLIDILPFVPVIYESFEAQLFVERAIDFFMEMNIPCPHTVSLALKGIVRRKEDRVHTLLRIHEMLASRECDLPDLTFGDLLTEEERKQAYTEGVPYDLLRAEGEAVPEDFLFSSADACLDHLLNISTPEERVRELAKECIERFGLFPPLVLFYLQVGGEPKMALKLIASRPKASMLLALRGLVPEDTFRELEKLLKVLSREEYALYVAESSPEDLLKLKGEVDEEVLKGLVLNNADRLGEAALPLLKEEILKIASGKRWKLYPKAAELLKTMRKISPDEYKETLYYLKDRFPNRRRLMEVLEKLEN
ncbi:MAG: hypothetical protein GXO39_01565 [Thermotogae bacterium]|nr:hypothetical protein [Thermotogota bacterium]